MLFHKKTDSCECQLLSFDEQKILINAICYTAKEFPAIAIAPAIAVVEKEKKSCG